MDNFLIKDEFFEFLDEITEDKIAEEIYNEIHPTFNEQFYFLNFIISNEIIPSKKIGAWDYYLFVNPYLSLEKRQIIENYKNNYYAVFKTLEKCENTVLIKSLLNDKIYKAYVLIKENIFSKIHPGTYFYSALFDYEDKKYLLPLVYLFDEKNDAIRAAASLIKQTPGLIVKDNKEKEKEVRRYTEKVYSKFIEIFKSDVVITNENLGIDLAERFLKYVDTDNPELLEGIEELIQPPEEFRWIDDENYEYDGTYDDGLIVDPKNGLSLSMGYGTFREIFTREDYKSVPNYKDCVKTYFKEYFNSKNIEHTHPVIVKVYNEVKDKEKALAIIKECLEDPEIENYSFEEIIKKYKGVNVDDYNFCQPEMPYLSETVKERELLMEQEVEELMLGNVPVKKENKIGRNDACPCGSGKKYKKCCINKIPKAS